MNPNSLNNADYIKFVGGNENWRDSFKYNRFLQDTPQFDRNDNMWAQKLNSFDQSVLASDGYRLRHNWDYLQSRFQDDPMMRLPDNQPYMTRPMQVDGPYPMGLPAVDQRSDMSTSQYDANVVAAELLKGSEQFFESVEDVENYYRDDGHQQGPNADMVKEAIMNAKNAYPAVRQHLNDMDSGVPVEQRQALEQLKRLVDEAITKALEIEKHLGASSSVSSSAISKLARSCGLGKKLFCTVVILLILAAAVYAGVLLYRAQKGEE